MTGATGFVGFYVLRALQDAFGPSCEIVALSRSVEVASVDNLDVTDPLAVRDTVRRYAPTHVLNLAGIAAPTQAASDPMASWSVHLHAVGHLAEAVLAEAPTCWLVHVGSGLVYGGAALSGQALTESSILDPVDVYAVSKAAGDLLLGAYAHKGLKCVRLRPFNHTGPGQSTDFVVPAFAMQIARIEVGLEEPVIRVGNLQAARDFLDVRDVARAYALTIGKAGELASGAILNVSSNTPIRMSEVLKRLLSKCRVSIAVEQDPARMRPVDIPQMYGDSTLASRLLGWRPSISLDETLETVLNHCRATVSKAEHLE